MVAKIVAAVTNQLNLPHNSPDLILQNGIRTFVIIIGAMAVIMIAIAAIQMITSGGNVEKTKTARKMLIWGIVGLLIALLAIVIISLIGSIV